MALSLRHLSQEGSIDEKVWPYWRRADCRRLRQRRERATGRAHGAASRSRRIARRRQLAAAQSRRANGPTRKALQGSRQGWRRQVDARRGRGGNAARRQELRARSTRTKRATSLWTRSRPLWRRCPAIDRFRPPGAGLRTRRAVCEGGLAVAKRRRSWETTLRRDWRTRSALRRAFGSFPFRPKAS